MSGWIKMGTGLGSHPKVKTMRRALKADRLRVIGGLWAVWCVFDEHSAGGRLDGYTLDDMDEEIGWKGFSQAMADIGWLVADDDGIEAPDYEEHNGPNAKRRALDSSRKGKSRAKGAAEEPDEVPHETGTTVRTDAGTVSASDADKTRNREEKRREEKDKTVVAAAATTAPPAPPLKAPDLIAEGVDPQHAADWLALRRAKRLPLTATAWADTKAEGAKVGMNAAQTVAKAVASNWAGFKAVWLQRDAARPGQVTQGADIFDGVH